MRLQLSELEETSEYLTVVYIQENTNCENTKREFLEINT